MAQKLRRTNVVKAATRPTEISALGVPAWFFACVLLPLVFATLWLVKNIFWWPVAFVAIGALWLTVRIILRRDYNGLRRLKLGIPKFFASDAHIWNGAAPSTFPRYPARQPRGINHARR